MCCCALPRPKAPAAPAAAAAAPEEAGEGKKKGKKGKKAALPAAASAAAVAAAAAAADAAVSGQASAAATAAVGPAPASAATAAAAAAAATPTDSASATAKTSLSASAAPYTASASAAQLATEAFFSGGAAGSDSLPAHVSAKLPRSRSTVACLTHDLSIQNSLLHCGLRVLTGQAALAVQQERRFVLRCSSCFTVCGDMGRQFCPSCGGHTLYRASVHTNARGEESYRWREGFRQMSTKRGTRYAIPTMLGGNIGKRQDLKLREDMMPMRRRRDVKAEEADRLGVLASTEGGFEGVGAHFGYVRNERRAEAVVGYGRKNPNQVRKFKG